MIIGGGIGGLSAALHLLRAGFDVQVYEQAPRITEIGAGIQISPNASRLLIRLGLKPALDAAGVLRSGRAPAPLGRRPHPAARAARHAGRGRRSARPTTISIAPISPTCWPRRCRPSACMSGTSWSTSSRRASGSSRASRTARRVEADAAGRRRRHPQQGAPHRVRAGEAALHRLRRLARPGAGRARRSSRHRGRLAQLDGAGRSRACTTGSRLAAS